MTWFGSIGWSNNDDAPLTSNNAKDEYFINMVPFRRNCKHNKQKEESKSLNVGVDIDAKLKQAVEREQNTRRLTKDRERLKQIKLRKKKQETRVFDIALLIKYDNEYYKILCGPIVYEVFYGYIRFTNSQQYMHDDIDFLRKSAELMEELDAKHVHEYFCNYSLDPNDRQNGVTFHFRDVSKIQLYRFQNDDDKHIWYEHKYTQTNTACDALIVANKQNVALYVLMNARMDLIDEEIHFEEIHEYQAGDDILLDNLGTKLMDFEIKQSYSFYKKDICQSSFHYNFGNAVKSSFSAAICYKFISNKTKHRFYHQSYDVALTTNDEDEMMHVLNDVIYNLMLAQIQYHSSHVYINGDYAQLKKCGVEIKCLKIKSFDSIHEATHDISHTKQCILFNISDADSWTQYIQKQKQSHFDVATITNTDDYLIYILLDVSVNWISKTIDFMICDTFKARHHKIIQQYGESIAEEKLRTFTFKQSGFKNDALNNIFFFQLKSDHHQNSGSDTINTIPAAIALKPSSSSPVPQMSSLKKKEAVLQPAQTMMDLTQRESIMPDRMSVLHNMHNVTKIKQKLSNQKQQQTQFTQTQNKHIRSMTQIDDKLINVWKSYVNIYGSEAQSIKQLKSFSKIQDDIPTLSYFQARVLFNHFTEQK